MTNFALARQRLHQHRLASGAFAAPEEAVAWLGAMQAQEYGPARWAVGIRCAGVTEASVAQAVAEGRLIRTWAMRGTLQLIAAADSRWLLELLGPVVLARRDAAYRKMGVGAADFEAIGPVLRDSLRGGPLTRPEVFAALERGGHSAAGQRGYYILTRAALMGWLCLGPLRGKQETYTLLENSAPDAPSLPRAEALAELARRYFSSHGPATLADYAWWSGLTLAEARVGLGAAQADLVEQRVNGQTYWAPTGPPPAKDAEPAAHLLPAFDEYVLGYTDRTAVLAARHSPRVMSVNGIFYPTLVIDGEVVGTWKRAVKKDTVTITLSPFAPLKKARQAAVAAAAERYGAFVGLKAVVAG